MAHVVVAAWQRHDANMVSLVTRTCLKVACMCLGHKEEIRLRDDGFDLLAHELCEGKTCPGNCWASLGPIPSHHPWDDG